MAQQFCDISHWQGEFPMHLLKALGHEFVMLKAADGYYMPDKDGRYRVYDETRHVDAYFVDNAVNAVEAGMHFAPYLFLRFLNTYLNNFAGDELMERQLGYLKDAISRLPEELRDISVVIVDVEHNPAELKEHGLTKGIVSDLLHQFIDLITNEFEHVILYTGSWWTDEWLTEEVCQYMVGRVYLWESEYRNVQLLTDSEGNTVGYSPEYFPSITKGFKQTFGRTLNELKTGAIFAHQYTDDGHIKGYNGDLDFNVTKLTISDIREMFGEYREPDPEEPMPETPENLEELEARLERAEAAIDILTQAFTKLSQSAIAAAVNIYDFIHGVEPEDPGEEPTDPPVEEPTDPPVEPGEWLTRYSWVSDPVLKDWSHYMKDGKRVAWDNIPSDEKVLYEIDPNGWMEGEGETYVLRIPQRNKNTGEINRNSNGGIIFDTRAEPTPKAPPKINKNSYPNGVWGFKQVLRGGSQADGGKAIILIGDENVPGHEYYAINPIRLRVRG